MSPKFNNHYDRKMYNRKRHRRRSAEARALEEPQYRQQVIEPKDDKWSFNDYLREQEEADGQEIDCEVGDREFIGDDDPDEVSSESVPDDQ